MSPNKAGKVAANQQHPGCQHNDDINRIGQLSIYWTPQNKTDLGGGKARTIKTLAKHKTNGEGTSASQRKRATTDPGPHNVVRKIKVGALTCKTPQRRQTRQSANPPLRQQQQPEKRLTAGTQNSKFSSPRLMVPRMQH